MGIIEEKGKKRENGVIRPKDHKQEIPGNGAAGT